jgi:tetratricopeptide (TPR) repeat protein
MKALGLALLALFSLSAVAAPTPSPFHPSCKAAYDDIQAGKHSEAAAKLAQCGAASKPSPDLTVILYDRVRILDALGRHDEALAQRVALTEKAHFETGLIDSFGPGPWSRDPERVKARKAIGIRRYDLLLDIAWGYHRAKNYQAAVDWAERAARHALTRYVPEDEFLPMDRDAGCAIGLRGLARFELDPQSGKLYWPDISRGYIRGCTKLPLAEDIATQPEPVRKRIDELKVRFDALQAEAGRVRASILKREAKPKSGDNSNGADAFKYLIQLTDRQKDLEPVFKQRAEFLSAETNTLGREPLSEIEVAP